MRALDSVLWASFCVITLGVSFARAQQGQQQTPDQQQNSGQPQNSDQPQTNQPSQPIPAYRSPFASAADNSDIVPQQGTPDNRSLSGAQDLSPFLVPNHSYWQPQINLYATANSNPGGIGTNSDWTAGAALSGAIDVHRVSGVSTMDVNYLTGGVLFGGGYGAGVVQALGFSDRFSFHRSTLSFFDQISYLPGSAFGYGGLGGLGGGSLPNTGSTGLGPVFGPGQTILAGTGQTLQNSAVVEVDTAVTPRARLTLAGGYYLLHYFSGNYYNSGNPSFRAGYNYALTRKDTIAVIYTFTHYAYGNSAQSINTNTAQFSYGRVITQRFSLQLGVGPQWNMSQIPLSVSAPTTTVTSTTSLGVAANASLIWTAKRYTLGASYSRWTNPGSGVFAGSNQNTVSSFLTRAMSRTFSSGISGGYSRNGGVTNSAGLFLNQNYNYWYASASLTHPFSATLGLTASYWVQHQNSNVACVAGTPCAANAFINFISCGLSWHERPLAF